MFGLAQADRVAKLSGAQCDCLRLVAEHRSSKEIARLLMISPHTVDQRLKRAANILAVDSRFEAARMFASYERENGLSRRLYESLVYQSPDLPHTPEAVQMVEPPSEQDPMGGSKASSTLHEVQASYFGMFEPRSKPRTLSSILSQSGYENDLSTTWRLFAVLVIMLAGVFGFAMLVSVVEGLSRIY
jgi:DNA-binding CsgD family transcriptional regulator